MKKHLVLFCLVLFSLASMAQWVVPATSTYRAFNGTAADTIDQLGHLNKSIYLSDRSNVVDVYMEVYLQRAGSHDYVDVALKGSLNGVKKTGIDTVRWYQTTADTTIIFNLFPSENATSFNLETSDTTLAFDATSNISNGIFWKYLHLDFDSDSIRAGNLGAAITIPKTGNPIRVVAITRR